MRPGPLSADLGTAAADKTVAKRPRETAKGLAKNPHVVKDHPDVQVTAETPGLVGDGLDGLRAHAPDLVWTMPTGHTYRLPPPPVLGEGSRPTTIPAPPPPIPAEPQPVLEPIQQPTRRVESRPARVRKRRRMLPVEARQEHRRQARRQRRTERAYTREDTLLAHDDHDTHRRQTRQARDRRRQHRKRQHL